MSLYSVIREAGPGFLDGGIAAQPDVADHAAFMNALAEEGSSSSRARSPAPRPAACAPC